MGRDSRRGADVRQCILCKEKFLVNEENRLLCNYCHILAGVQLEPEQVEEKAIARKGDWNDN